MAAPLPVFSNDQVAAFIRSGYWGGPDYRWNMGSSGTAPQSGVLTYNINGLTDGRAAIANQALALYETILGIDFVPGGGAADIIFDDSYFGAYASFSTSGNIHHQRLRQRRRRLVRGAATRSATYSFQTYLHEIGTPSVSATPATTTATPPT